MNNISTPKDEEQDDCTLSDSRLLEKCEEWITKMCETGGKAWTLKVPVDFNSDPDMLFTELQKRYKKLLLSTGKEVEKEADQQNKISKAIEWCDERMKKYDKVNGRNDNTFYSGKADAFEDCKTFLQSLK